MKKPSNAEKWGKDTAAKRYADGGTVAGRKPLSIADSPGGMNFPPAPDDNGGRMASARTSGSRAVVEREVASFHKRSK